MTGTVYLVGIGPGNPRHLTLRAAEILARVSAVLSPARVPEAVLAHAPAGVELFPEAFPEENGDLLIDLARRHSAVARLYFGDPFILNSGPLEAAALAAAGVPFEVVPGIPSAPAAAISVGIPLTGLDGGRPVLFHRAPLSDSSVAAVTELLRAGGCVAVQGSNGELADVLGTLRSAGIAADTPAELVRRGGYPDQLAVAGTLGAIFIEGGNGDFVLLVGSSAARQPALEWFSNRPLFGKCIVVTRPRDQAAAFVTALEERGAGVMAMPLIRIVEPDDPSGLLRAAREAGRYDWAVFTSVNGVVRFWDALRSVGLDTRALGGVGLCAIGPATAAAVEREGARVDLLPDRFVAESVAEALSQGGRLEGSRVLLPRAELGRDVLPKELRRLGAIVDDVVAYRTVPDDSGVHRLREALATGRVDLITFTSSSAVRYFAELVSPAAPAALLASIGPITSATLRDLGWEVAVEATEHTTRGLVEATVDYFRTSGGS